MFALWEKSAFHDVTDYETWESRLLEDSDIENEIAAGRLVPINIHGDSVSEIEVRVGTQAAQASLSERESRHITVSTPAPYFLHAKTTLYFGGIEHVAADPPPETGSLAIEPGDYQVQVHLIDWQQEPDMVNPDGSPKLGALPDFIVVLNPVGNQRPSRVSVNTFD
jgi:hypothetical protein